MSSAPITADAQPAIADFQRDTPPGLHVAFLSEGSGRVAECAAHLTRELASDGLEVEAASFDRAEVALSQNDAGASLVVVLHTPGDSAPTLVENNGGRIDWYLETDPASARPTELVIQLWRHVVRLLDDLGIEIARSAAYILRPGYRSLRLDPERPFFRWCPRVTAAAFVA